MTNAAPPPGYPQPVDMQAYGQGVARDKPKVVRWFAVYAYLMALLYLLAMGLGLAFAMWPDEWITEPHETPDVMRFQGIGIVVVAVPLLVLFGVAPLLPRRRWVWIYDLVMICIGLTSCCLWPISIPLVIHWVKPEAKWWFGGRD